MSEASEFVKLNGRQARRVVENEDFVIIFYSKSIPDKALTSLRTFAAKFKDIIKVGALECSAGDSFCKEHGFETGYRVKLFTGKGKVSEVLPETDWRQLAEHAVRHLPDKVLKITSMQDYISKFLKDNPSTLPRALLVQGDKASPSIFKALASKYDGKYLFG